MMKFQHRPGSARWLRVLAVTALALASAGVVHAVEIIPSIGATKSIDDNGGDAQAFGGLAIHAPLLTFLRLEGGIAYRVDTYSNGDLKARQWPVTASVWAAPFPMVYAGGGIGWYRTTLDYNSNLPYHDTTSNRMGVHLGGGVIVPVAPKLGIDVSGRYIFMQKDANNVQLPTTFNPDFWNLAVGLAIKF